MTIFDIPILVPSAIVQIVGTISLQVSGLWTMVGRTGEVGNIFWFVDADNPNSRRQVAVSCLQEQDGRRWLHVSVARRHKMPSYKDLTEIKDDFLGEKRKAIMVFPPKAEHVNIHPFCLHLFSCLDNDSLPDFTGGTPLI